METGLTGKVAFVSGGSGAIGRAIALALAAEGAAVAVSWRSGKDRAADVVEQIVRSGGTAQAVHLDQRDQASSRATLHEVDQVLGRVSVLVANAVEWPSRDLDEVDGLAASLIANTVGSAGLIDAALPGMRAAKFGRIVVVSTDIVGQPMAGPLA